MYIAITDQVPRLFEISFLLNYERQAAAAATTWELNLFRVNEKIQLQFTENKKLSQSKRKIR